MILFSITVFLIFLFEIIDIDRTTLVTMKLLSETLSAFFWKTRFLQVRKVFSTLAQDKMFKHSEKVTFMLMTGLSR